MEFFGLFLLHLELNAEDIFRPEKGGATLMGGPSRQANLSIDREGSLPGSIRSPQLTESQLSSRMMAPSVGTMLLLLIVTLTYSEHQVGARHCVKYITSS